MYLLPIKLIMTIHIMTIHHCMETRELKNYLPDIVFSFLLSLGFGKPQKCFLDYYFLFDYIIDCIFHFRDNPCPHLGSIVTIKLSENQENVPQNDNTYLTMIVETHFQVIISIKLR